MIWNMNLVLSALQCLSLIELKNVYAAISISGMANHFTDANIAEWAMLLKKYIRKIESRL